MAIAAGLYRGARDFYPEKLPMHARRPSTQGLVGNSPNTSLATTGSSNQWLPPMPPAPTEASGGMPRIPSKGEVDAKRAAVARADGSKHLPKLKIMVQGLHQCGATSLVNRYCLNLATDPLYSTLSVDFKSKDVQVHGKMYSAQFWDAPGMESRRHMSTMFYKFMHGFVVCYDSTDRRSFDDVRTYYANAIEVLAFVPDVPVVLAATKCDDTTRREVDPDEGQALADSLGWQFFEVSARQNINVDAAFEAVLSQAARVQIPSPGQASTPRSIWQTLWEGAFTCCMSPSSEDDPRDKDPPHPMPVAYSPR